MALLLGGTGPLLLGKELGSGGPCHVLEPGGGEMWRRPSVCGSDTAVTHRLLS